jgi:hypothetical protein
VNDIANLTFVSQGANNDIGDKPPWQYLKDIPKDVRVAHFIPSDPKLWTSENFSDFLEERRRLLASAMTRFLKKLG